MGTDGVGGLAILVEGNAALPRRRAGGGQRDGGDQRIARVELAIAGTINPELQGVRGVGSLIHTVIDRDALGISRCGREHLDGRHGSGRRAHRQTLLQRSDCLDGKRPFATSSGLARVPAQKPSRRVTQRDGHPVLLRQSRNPNDSPKA